MLTVACEVVDTERDDTRINHSRNSSISFLMSSIHFSTLQFSVQPVPANHIVLCAPRTCWIHFVQVIVIIILMSFVEPHPRWIGLVHPGNQFRFPSFLRQLTLSQRLFELTYYQYIRIHCIDSLLHCSLLSSAPHLVRFAHSGVGLFFSRSHTAELNLIFSSMAITRKNPTSENCNNLPRIFQYANVLYSKTVYCVVSDYQKYILFSSSMFAIYIHRGSRLPVFI